ncbi:MAG: acyl-CoA dehydrogenase family protein, partial [Actinomycetota bacterium]
MDFAWSSEQVLLRKRARELAADAVARYGRANDSWMNGYSKEFSRELGREGFSGMTWPV